MEEAVVGLVDVLAYDLPRGTDKNHENFIQHNRRSGEIRRAAPPKKQEGVAVPANSLYITHAYYYYYYYYYYYFSCHRPFLPFIIIIIIIIINNNNNNLFTTSCTDTADI